MFTNGIDEEFFFYKQKIHNIFVNPNHSFLFILSTDKRLSEDALYQKTKFWNDFDEYCKSNNLKVEVVEMNEKKEK